MDYMLYKLSFNLSISWSSCWIFWLGAVVYLILKGNCTFVWSSETNESTYL